MNDPRTAGSDRNNAGRFGSKIPVPGAIQRANSTGNSSRSAPSPGHTTPIMMDHHKVTYRRPRTSTTYSRLDPATVSKNRLSLNDQAFKSLPSSVATSPATKKRNASVSSASNTSLSSNGGTAVAAHRGQQNSVQKIAVTKTNSSSTPDEMRQARTKQRQMPDVFSRLSKSSGDKRNSPNLSAEKRRQQQQKPNGDSHSTTHSQSSSRSGSLSPSEFNAYTTGARRSTMPSRGSSSKQQVTKETSALAKLALKITRWAQRTQTEIEPPPVVAKTRQEALPVRKSPSPYDRDGNSSLPVRRSSFRLKGSRGPSISSISSAPDESESISSSVIDTSYSLNSDRDLDTIFTDSTTTPVAQNNRSRSFQSPSQEQLGLDSSSSAESPAVMTVIKRPPQDGIVQRVPYFRKMAGSSPSRVAELGQCVGELNLDDVEGTVVIDADEYRRMSQEVKALKTVLLKLKRELQVDTQGISQASGSRGGKTPRGRRPSPSPPDLTVKVEQLTQDKVQLNSKLDKVRRELVARDTKLEELETKVGAQQEEEKQLKEKQLFLEKHREYLLDKVERLHADKHKLEDRISVMEKGQDFDQTLSDLEISEDEEDQHNTKSDHTSYDISDGCLEENSDPESQAAI